MPLPTCVRSSLSSLEIIDRSFGRFLPASGVTAARLLDEQSRRKRREWRAELCSPGRRDRPSEDLSIVLGKLPWCPLARYPFSLTVAHRAVIQRDRRVPRRFSARATTGRLSIFLSLSPWESTWSLHFRRAFRLRGRALKGIPSSSASQIFPFRVYTIPQRHVECIRCAPSEKCRAEKYGLSLSKVNVGTPAMRTRECARALGVRSAISSFPFPPFFYRNRAHRGDRKGGRGDIVVGNGAFVRLLNSIMSFLKLIAVLRFINP